MTKAIQIEELKAIQLEILQSIHDFCQENDLIYMLAFGTLLGAVRHKGFIPWDDDIDIMMPRKDYEQFVQSYKHSYYKVYDYRKDEDYVHPYAKVADTRTLLIEKANMKDIGINIDIFPLDGLADTREGAVDFLKSLTPIKNKFRMKVLKPSPKNVWWKRIAIQLSKLLVLNVSLKSLAQEINQRISDNPHKDSAYMGTPSGTDPHAINNIYERELFDSYITLPFEDRSFLAPVGYDQILRNYYGDYMQLPPIEKRTSPHTLCEVYWLE